MIHILRWLGVIFGLGIASASASTCATETFDGAPFSYCVINLRTETLRLWRADETGQPYGTFNALDKSLRKTGIALGIAMNGGMYHADRDPVGLYIEDGKQVSPIVTRDGPGNFGLLPNGVFCVKDGTAAVVESRTFAARPLDCTFATQSGPMLVIDGALHPRFLVASDSLNIRNGVGVRDNGQDVVMVISDRAVNFHHFARFFRDRLNIRNALYLDGRVSKLYAPSLGRNDRGAPMGPILGTVVPTN